VGRLPKQIRDPGIRLVPITDCECVIDRRVQRGDLTVQLFSFGNLIVPVVDATVTWTRFLEFLDARGSIAPVAGLDGVSDRDGWARRCNDCRLGGWRRQWLYRWRRDGFTGGRVKELDRKSVV
jgi:hypothetical protein